MRIEEDYIANGKKYHVVYNDVDSFEHLPQEKITQHYGVCFYGEKIVVCWHGKKEEWTLPGGKVEAGESLEQTLLREVAEETNMSVISHAPIGYQEVFREDGTSVIQLRSVCTVEPIGGFVADKDGSITKIEYIDAKDWNDYIHWGDVGKRILERAQEIKR